MVDLYVAGHLFINSGGMSFVNRSFDYGLPWCATLTTNGTPSCASPTGKDIGAGDLTIFDEGLKFFDANNNGLLDLAVLQPVKGLVVYHQRYVSCATGSGAAKSCTTRFDAGLTQASTQAAVDCQRGGMQAADFDGDGREDIFVGGSGCEPPVVLMNTMTGYQPVALAANPAIDGVANTTSVADFDGTGLSSVIMPLQGAFALISATAAAGSMAGAFVVEITGPSGERNQQGRVVRVAPAGQSASGSTMCPQGSAVCYTRVVDGGSGYLGAGEYPVLISTAFAGVHHGEVVLPVYASAGSVRTVSFDVSPGQYVRIYAPTVSAAAKVVVCSDSGAPLPVGWTTSGCGGTQTGGTDFVLQVPATATSVEALTTDSSVTISSDLAVAAPAGAKSGGGGSLTLADLTLLALVGLRRSGQRTAALAEATRR